MLRKSRLLRALCGVEAWARRCYGEEELLSGSELSRAEAPRSGRHGRIGH
jgi:hypothetical protein